MCWPLNTEMTSLWVVLVGNNSFHPRLAQQNHISIYRWDKNMGHMTTASIFSGAKHHRLYTHTHTHKVKTTTWASHFLIPNFARLPRTHDTLKMLYSEQICEKLCDHIIVQATASESLPHENSGEEKNHRVRGQSCGNRFIAPTFSTSVVFPPYFIYFFPQSLVSMHHRTNLCRKKRPLIINLFLPPLQCLAETRRSKDTWL